MNIGLHHSLVFFSSRFSAPWTSGGWLLHIVCCQSKCLFFSEFLTDHPALISIHSQYPLSLLHHPVLFYLEHLSLVNITVCSFFMCLLIFSCDPHMEGLYEQETCLFCPSLKSVPEEHLGHSCSVAKLHLTLYGSKDCSPPGFPVLYCLPGFAQIHVHWVSDAIHWSGVPCPSPGVLPDPGIESAPLLFPALAGRFFITRATYEDLRT